MSQGFDVDLEVLGGAAAAISQTMRDVGKRQLDDFGGPAKQYGHTELHKAFEHFSDRWQHGLGLLIDDAGTVAQALIRAADVYRESDGTAARRFEALGDGAGPAFGAVDG